MWQVCAGSAYEMLQPRGLDLFIGNVDTRLISISSSKHGMHRDRLEGKGSSKQSLCTAMFVGKWETVLLPAMKVDPCIFHQPMDKSHLGRYTTSIPILPL